MSSNRKKDTHVLARYFFTSGLADQGRQDFLPPLCYMLPPRDLTVSKAANSMRTDHRSPVPAAHKTGTWVLMVAGEASADMHGAQVVRALKKSRPDLGIFGVGGAAMREAKFDATIRAEDMSLGGLTEVVWALPRMVSYLRRLLRLATILRPAVAILIDLPDFNLPLARKLKRLGIPVVYYISPQIWAWRRRRVHQIRHVVDHMLVILPFEKPFYARYGMQVEFVGHPLLEELPPPLEHTEARRRLNLQEHRGEVVAVLPGSRPKEVVRNLPTMLAGVAAVLPRFPHLKVLIPVASTVPRELVASIIQRLAIPGVRALPERASEVIGAADVVLVCSGTATLQTALLLRPMVVVYRVSWLTYQILRRLVHVAHIGLVNLIAGRRLVPELLQGTFNAHNVAYELTRLLRDADLRQRLRDDLASLRRTLGDGHTADRVAAVAQRYLPQPSRSGSLS